MVATALEVAEPSLVAAAKRGDDQAFALLYREYRPRLVRLVAGWTSDSHLAEDIAQETLQRAHRALPGFRVEQPLWPWLATIARNATTDHRRRMRDVVPLDEDDAPSEDAMSRIDDRLEIEHALMALPERSREALLLVYGDGLGSDEAAQVLGTTRAALQKLLQRSRPLFIAAVRRGRVVGGAVAGRVALDPAPLGRL